MMFVKKLMIVLFCYEIFKCMYISYINELKYLKKILNFYLIRFFYWDVNNENFYGDWYECNIIDLDIIFKMF